MPPRILLLQARHSDDPSAADERRSFAFRMGLPVERVVPHDLLERAPTLAEVRAADALTVGGSGDFYVSRGNLASLPALYEVLAEVAAVGHPTFASCFGYQCMVQALGGEIDHDPDNTEVGTFDLELTAAGRDDELFGTLPPVFPAQLGHKDRAVRQPPGIPNLAASPRSPLQALRIPGQPVWASQFHPELTGEENLARFDRYLEGYAAYMDPAQQEEARSGFRESPATERLLPRFIELVCG